MRQITAGNSDKLGKYREFLGGEMLSTMQNLEQRRTDIRKPKRFRSAFTTEQTVYLEEAYKKFPYINKEERQHLASILKIGERPIKIWFQNRRMKEKKETQNHKEFDYEIRVVQKCGQIQLNNVPALPSTNDNHSHSLPILSLTADSTVHANTDIKKTEDSDTKNDLQNKTESRNSTIPNVEQKISTLKANFYKEVNSVEEEQHSSPYFDQQPTIDSTVRSSHDMRKVESPSQKYDATTSAEFSINLCKKYKQQHPSTESAVSGNIANEDTKMKTENKQPKKHKETCHFDRTNDFPPRKKSKIRNPPLLASLPHRVNTTMNKPMYYPVMPNVYPPPYVAPDGVLWKPVNFMPVVATNGPPINIGNQVLPVSEPNSGCNCNCHGKSRHVPVSLPPSLQNPYAQYMITVPFSHTSPSF